jgi:hypothetical protein
LPITLENKNSEGETQILPITLENKNSEGETQILPITLENKNSEGETQILLVWRQRSEVVRGERSRRGFTPRRCSSTKQYEL